MKPEGKLNLGACLAREAARWQARGYEGLMAELHDTLVYELEGGIQVEVQVLERRPEYIHVSIAMDNGGLRSFMPLCTSIIVEPERPSAATGSGAPAIPAPQKPGSPSG